MHRTPRRSSTWESFTLDDIALDGPGSSHEMPRCPRFLFAAWGACVTMAPADCPKFRQLRGKRGEHVSSWNTAVKSKESRRTWNEPHVSTSVVVCEESGDVRKCSKEVFIEATGTNTRCSIAAGHNVQCELQYSQLKEIQLDQFTHMFPMR